MGTFISAKIIDTMNEFGAQNVVRIWMDSANQAEWVIIRTKDGLTLSKCLSAGAWPRDRHRASTGAEPGSNGSRGQDE